MNPIKRFGYVGDGKRAMLLLKQRILDVVMLRRTKLERAADVKLPALTVRVRRLALAPEERDFYECIYRRTKAKFDTFVQKDTLCVTRPPLVPLATTRC